MSTRDMAGEPAHVWPNSCRLGQSLKLAISAAVEMGEDERGIAFLVSIGTMSDLSLGCTRKSLVNCGLDTKVLSLPGARVAVLSMLAIPKNCIESTEC
jgi:hypothetical protein